MGRILASRCGGFGGNRGYVMELPGMRLMVVWLNSRCWHWSSPILARPPLAGYEFLDGGEVFVEAAVQQVVVAGAGDD